MADKTKLRIFDITVDSKNVAESVRPILNELKPEWRDLDLEKEQFSKGYINSMTCFYRKDDAERKDGLVVRVHGMNLEEYGYSRQNEILVMQLAGAAGAFPPVYATFNNGVVYRYFPGRVLTYADFNNPKIIKTITSVLYRFHHVDIDNTVCVDHKGNPAKFDKTPKFFNELKNWFAMIPETPKKAELKEKFSEYRQEFTDEVLLREYDYIQSILSDMDIPLALNHADLHIHNMLYNLETEQICLIDFEVACMGYHVQDLGRLFNVQPVLETIGMIPKGEPEISPEARQLWLRGYLEAKYENEGKNPQDVTEEEMTLLDLEVAIFEIIAQFECLAFAGMVDVNADVGIDLLEAVPQLKASYFSRKEELLSLKDQYFSLKKKLDGRV